MKRIDFLKDTRELLRWRRAAEEGLQGRAAFRTGSGRVLKDEELHQVAGSMAERMRRPCHDDSHDYPMTIPWKYAMLVQEIAAKSDLFNIWGRM